MKILCEIQLTLSPIVILKKSEQKIYSLMRMESPTELLEQYVFSRKSEEDESTVLTHQSQYSDVAPPGGPLNTKKKAIAAAGLMADSDEAPLLGVTGKDEPNLGAAVAYVESNDEDKDFQGRAETGHQWLLFQRMTRVSF